MIRSREDIALANRIVLKAGTSVVSTPDGYPSLSRMANIVEHAAKLVREGKEVLIVTSGAVGVGRQKLSKQAILRRSMSDLIIQREPGILSTVGGGDKKSLTYNSACAAAGQLGLMSLYETMFSQFDITVSQLLVTSFDFTSPERRRNIQHVISQLLALGIVPLLNENDAVSANQGYQTFGKTFSDNDSLASLVAVEMSAQLLILLTDVQGVYDRPPSDPEAQIIDIFREETTFKAGDKSLQGRGGMGAKVDAALNAIHGGVQAVIIAAGHDTATIGKIMDGEKVGTLFLGTESEPNSPVPKVASTTTVEENLAEQVASRVRDASRQLAAAESGVRKAILEILAQKLLDNLASILSSNEEDLLEAGKSGLAKPLLSRLKLTEQKVQALVEGIRTIAESKDPVLETQSRLEVAENLCLDQVTCPIGVLLIIFESRPDCLPQIAALAIKSGNGVILKGGKEAERTNKELLRIVQEAVKEGSGNLIDEKVVSLVASREDVRALLSMDHYIDLVIPRGSNQLVQSIQQNTKIAVLGHADGVCHIFIDEHADETKAIRIVLDSKVDYPSACNAVETILIHESCLETGMADRLLRALRKSGVSIYGGGRAVEAGLVEQKAVSMHTEYSDLSVTVEIVDDIDQAVSHIHRFGSGHTESIVTEDSQQAEKFLRLVDSACVFHNASTRFADGFRFGLGAEVGISTGRIHARGPVGVEGLLTTKWLLRSSAEQGHIVSSNASSSVYNASDTPVYTHKRLL